MMTARATPETRARTRDGDPLGKRRVSETIRDRTRSRHSRGLVNVGDLQERRPTYETERDRDRVLLFLWSGFDSQPAHCAKSLQIRT